MTTHAAQVREPFVRMGVLRLVRYMVLVPEAVLLVGLLLIYALWLPYAGVALTGIGLAIWFGARIGLLIIARSLLSHAHYQRAAMFTRWSLLLYPYSADALGLLGTILLTSGQASAAIPQLARSVAIYPWQPAMYTLLATAQLDVGDLAAARQTARMALALNSHYGPAYLALAEAEERLGADRDLIVALLQQGQALPLLPADQAAFQCAHAALLVRNGQAPEAVRALHAAERLIRHCPPIHQASLHFQVGTLWHQCDQPDAARVHFYASAELDPHGPYAAAAWRAART